MILSNCALHELCNDKTKLSNEDSKTEYRMISQPYTEAEAKEQIPKFLEMINQVFTIDAPKATQKIGLTYLASIIKQFPELCDRYLEIILNVSQEIRTDVLLVPEDEHDEKQFMKQEYVAGCSSGKYLSFSSYQYWDQTKIIQSLEKVVLQNSSEEMENLDWPHLEVFKAACRIDTRSEKDAHLKQETAEWTRIFKALKGYIFISLCNRDYSDTAIEILETFTNKFAEIKNECLDDSLMIMIQTLQLIYQPDIEQECRDNINLYLQNLYFGHPEYNHIPVEQKQKDFVYNSIKNFAEMNKKAYQESNMVPLMNQIV